MERSAFLAAQIGLDIVSVAEVWSMCEYLEATPEQRAALANPPQSARVPRNGRSPALLWAPMAKWRQVRARRITEAQYRAEIEWHLWASRNATTHPDFTYRRPLDRGAAPIPRFGVVA